MLKTNLHISDFYWTYKLVSPKWIIDLQGISSGLWFPSRGKVYLKQSTRMTTGISVWDRTTSTFRYVVPTELLWEFPCSMTAKSVQPQNTRQLLWAVGERNYTLAHTCTARALTAAQFPWYISIKWAINLLSRGSYLISSGFIIKGELLPTGVLTQLWHGTSMTQWCCGVADADYAKPHGQIKPTLSELLDSTKGKWGDRFFC